MLHGTRLYRCCCVNMGLRLLCRGKKERERKKERKRKRKKERKKERTSFCHGEFAKANKKREKKNKKKKNS